MGSQTQWEDRVVRPNGVAASKRWVRIGCWLLVAYVVGRLTVAIAVPAFYIQREWVLETAMKCMNRQDLCAAVQVENAVVGNLWWGKAFYFTARRGKGEELKSYVVAAMPIQKWERVFTPWNYIGATFREEDGP